MNWNRATSMATITAREMYARFYLLLPQFSSQAERERWLVALAPIAAHNMLTVGFSADDAGNGDGLKARIVYAVNPAQIGTGLTQAWFDCYYPGVEMIAFEADSPEEFLTQWRGA